ncbi:hypothetical protein NECAME_13554 [Necator americanus]|uniref:Uncharacterized protein n=1 Tax=Necator americanus TaxID=51031 RepID=W2SUF7_NECAM|nr:hypothetical protein NECAME_13554 [Necator americanus]ETN73374.1 hypothetical protein NECAME_13554 [Necator americanus]
MDTVTTFVGSSKLIKAGLGLEQFEYSNETSGLRYGCRPPERKGNNFNEKASHADEKDRVDVKFNRFTPPVTLASGLCLHLQFFFNVKNISRVTDIWRSYFAQKLLHVIGENIAFYPANAIQLGNSHDLFSDFRTERDYHLYKNFGNLLRFLDDWNCDHTSLAKCVLKLAEEFSARKFWGKTDVALIRNWIEDLHNIT